MSSHLNGDALRPRATVANGSSTKTLIPTNSVTTKDGVVKVRIDPTLMVADVVKQLVANLQIKQPPSDFALRDEDDELVTNENLRKMIKSKAKLKLVNSALVEAREIHEKLLLREEKSFRLALFSLQRYLHEEDFANEFLKRDGVRILVDVITTSYGNTLAYALTAMKNLMDLEYGWAALDSNFIFKVVQIIASPQSLINVCRPATAILKRLVEADPASAPGPLVASSSRSPPAAPPGSVYRYGFDVVFEQMRKEPGLLETVVSRLGTADTALALNSVMLINSLLAHATDTWWEVFISQLERLNTRKAIIHLMTSHTIEDLTSCVLDFQGNMARLIYRKKTTLVEPDVEETHAAALDYIWTNSHLQVETSPNGTPLKWRQLGFASENLSHEFSEAGVLGLDCLKYFVQSDPEFFSKVVQEQNSRPSQRQCPLARASNEVVELLSEYWDATSPVFQPFFLNFYKVHALATNFFLQMWNESGAAIADFTRVVALVRSQVKVALRQEHLRPWHEMVQDFSDCEYRGVRDRQMKELEEEDDLLSKIPVRNLRAKLYKESKEFVRQQRIHCLLEGAWFLNAVPVTAPASRRPARPWRFMRLDNSLKHLHYVDSQSKFPVRSGLEDLPERIDLALIIEIATANCALPSDGGGGSGPPPLVASPLSFSLLTSEGSLADAIAPDVSRWADWTDGLNMLRRDSGHVSSKETADFIQALTEIGLRIKLLDLSGDKVEIPSGLTAGPPPANSDFFFSDLYDPQ
ncbi:ELMO/CED-12 family-domain-containing protein [Multifurca ochricompacta]|uniref:ELMO/CED-12 family-domain-containing protein n=1 Tax=Multifurca ochricompacta TaxID=376703 RepID=A0AAD4QRI5_9AGAM|nr:ELMO/CED-12 family-domain-containing protein [Multifurca ochricompacta]